MKTFSTTFILTVLFLASMFTTSTAQVSWTKDPGNPILSGGDAGSWNRHLFMPAVVHNPDSARYEMWFSACVGKNDNNWRPYRIGFATSDNVSDWTMHPTAVLTPSPGEWDQFTVEQQFVIRENGQYRMWYGGTLPGFENASIGYATSPDGIDWTKDNLNNPLIGPGTDSWDGGGVSNCFIMPVQDGYKMWYTGWDINFVTANVGYAWSVDGIHWQRDTVNNPVLTTGKPLQWDNTWVGWPQVLLIENKYYMWFHGSNGSSRQMGLAISDSGVHWTKYNDPGTNDIVYADSDPVLKPTPGQWDGNYLETGSVMRDADTLHLWYGGGRNPTETYLWRIGHATLPLDSLLEWVRTGIEAYDNTYIPEEYSLSQNYPNPFNPSTTIEFQIPNSKFTILKVYNVLGKEVATLISNKLNQGNHTYQFDGKNLASGVYYYQLVAGDYREVKKMILLR